MTVRNETTSRGGARRDEDGVAGGRRTSANATRADEREAFLDALAETCNVGTAAMAAGRAAKTFYALRRRDPQFAEQWIAALTIGYGAVEARLIDYALGRSSGRSPDAIPDAVFDDAVDPVETATPPILRPGTGLVSGGRTPTMAGVPPEIQVGLLLLARHRATLDGGKPVRNGRRVATAAETDAVLNKRLDQLARSLGQRR